MTDRVLILGAHGTLGQELVRVFGVRASEGEVFAWDRAACDITDRVMVLEKISALQPSIIINAAAYNDVDGAEANDATAIAVNARAPGYLAEAALAIGATFVHYSTDYVFDGTKKEGYTEDDIPAPVSAYGRSKFAGEQAVVRVYSSPLPDLSRPERREVGLRGVGASMPAWFIVRTSRLFGLPGGGKESFVDKMLRLGRERDELKIIDEEVSSPTYAADLAVWTASFLLPPFKGEREGVTASPPSGLYHASNSGSCTWFQFAQEIFRVAHELKLIEKIPRLIPVPGDAFPRAAKRPAYSVLRSTRLPPPPRGGVGGGDGFRMRPWQDALRSYLQTIT